LLHLLHLQLQTMKHFLGLCFAFFRVLLSFLQVLYLLFTLIFLHLQPFSVQQKPFPF
jgi:hypothetical protein